VTKLLVFISQAPATEAHIKEELQNHANWLIAVLSFIPDNEETIAFIETFSVTEMLFEVARDTIRFGGDKVSQTTQNYCFLGHSKQGGIMSAGPFWSGQCVPWLPWFSGKMK
jgi:hypothetical protein